MPQKRPEYLPNQCYHFYNRGAHRVSIFKEPDNYLYVLRKVKKYLAPEFVQLNFPSANDYRAFVFADLRGRDLPVEIKKYLDLDEL